MSEGRECACDELRSDKYEPSDVADVRGTAGSAGDGDDDDAEQSCFRREASEGEGHHAGAVRHRRGSAATARRGAVRTFGVKRRAARRKERAGAAGDILA